MGPPDHLGLICRALTSDNAGWAPDFDYRERAMGKIEIDLSELGMSGEGDFANELRAAVIQGAVRQLVNQMDKEAMHAIKVTVQSVVERQVAAKVREALEKPIQKTTRWGEAQGEPTSILEIVREELEQFMSAKSYRETSYSSSKPPENLAEMVGDVVRIALRSELAPAIKEAREAVQDRIAEALLPAVAKAVVKK